MLTPNDNPEVPDFEDEHRPSGSASQPPLSQEELEKLAKFKRLAEESDANAAGGQLGLGLPDDISKSTGLEDEDLFASDLIGDRENPGELYDLYYAIRRLLMRGLPTGLDNKAIRDAVYDEKNLYLRGGVPRPADGKPIGADSRQGLLIRQRAAYTATQAWSERAGSTWDIFLAFYNLNKAEGFR